MVTAETGKRALPAVALIMVCLALFANTLPNDFIWDDRALILENRYIKDPGNITLVFTPRYWNDLHPISPSGQYRPLRTISFIVDHYIWKSNPVGFHLTNLLLHTINVVLVYCLVMMLFSRNPSDNFHMKSGQRWLLSLPFLTALFFAAHPIHTESINYIKNRSDLLALLLYLLSFILFTKYASQEKFRSRLFLYTGALVCFCLAIISKEMALTLPAVIIVYALCFWHGQKRVKTIFSAIPFLGLSGLYCIFHQAALESGSITDSNPGFGNWPHTLTVIKTLGCYLKLLILPVNLNAERIFSIPESVWTPAVISSLAALAACTVLASALYKKNKTAFFSLCWIFLTLVPAANIIYLDSRPLAEQRLYMPSLGYCLLLGIAVNRLFFFETKSLNRIKPRLALVLAVSIFVFFSFSTIRRNFDWRDEVTFFSKAVKRTPESFRMHFNLGAALFREQRPAEAVRHYKRALQLKPDFAGGLNNLGLALLTMGRPEAAAEKFQAAVKIDPDFDQAYNNLGLVRKHQGDIEQAIEHFKKALELRPDSAEAFNNLGLALMAKGAWDEAVEKYRAALIINPAYAQAHNNLGVCLFEMREFDEAREHFVTALNINPDYPDGHYNLGVVLAADNKIQTAITHFTMAIGIDPGHVMARKGLAECRKIIMESEGRSERESSRLQPVRKD